MSTIDKLVLSLILCSVVTVQAEELLVYTFDDQSPAVSSVSAYLEASDVDFADTSFAPNRSFLLGNPAPGVLANASGTELKARLPAEALSFNTYIGFKVSPDKHYEIDLACFKVDAQGLNGALGEAGSTTEYAFGLYSSVDGWKSTADMIGKSQSITFTSTEGGHIQGGFTTLTFNIESLPNLDSDIEFRLYIWVPETGGSTPNNNRRLSLDNIILDGSVSPKL